MNWAAEHFDHFLLALLAVASAAASIWCDIHGHSDAAKWLAGQTTGFTGALMLRMNGPRGGTTPPGPLAPA